MFVKPPPCSLDSSWTEHNIAHFHTQHHLNKLTREYIYLWLMIQTCLNVLVIRKYILWEIILDQEEYLMRVINHKTSSHKTLIVIKK